jgi:hypothetical protein
MKKALVLVSALGLAIAASGIAAADRRGATQQAPIDKSKATWSGTIRWELRRDPQLPSNRILQRGFVNPTNASQIIYRHDKESNTDIWFMNAPWAASVDEFHEYTVDVPTPHTCRRTLSGSGSGPEIRMVVVIHVPTRTYGVTVEQHPVDGRSPTFSAQEIYSCEPWKNRTTLRPLWEAGAHTDRARALPPDWNRTRRLSGSATWDARNWKVANLAATFTWDLRMQAPTIDPRPAAVDIRIARSPGRGRLLRFRLSERTTVWGEFTLVSQCHRGTCGGRPRVVRRFQKRTYAKGPVRLALGRLESGLYRARLVLVDRAGQKRVLVRDIHL